MLTEAGRESLQEYIRESINNSKGTSHLMEVAEFILECTKGKWRLDGITYRKEFISQNGITFRSLRGENIGFKTLTIWRFSEGVKEDGITFLVKKDKDLKNGFEGLIYLQEEARKNVIQEEERGKLIDDSWTVDPQEPITGDAALPKAKEILGELLGEIG